MELILFPANDQHLFRRLRSTWRLLMQRSLRPPKRLFRQMKRVMPGRQRQKQPRTRYYRGGKLHETRAFVVGHGKQYRRPKSLPPLIGTLTDALAGCAPSGWAFAVLMPLK